MTREDQIIGSLSEQFPFLDGQVYSPREKRIFTKPLPPQAFEQLIQYAHDKLDFYRACHVVGTDDGETLGLLYILSDSENVLLMLRESVPKAQPAVKSVCGLYPSIILHERELVDLFGVTVEGLPEGPHYPLPDGWPEGNYPLRKDWDPKRFNKATMTYAKSEEEKKNG